MTYRFVLCGVITLLFVVGTVSGYSHLANEIPNGKRVPHPGHPNELWEGVGHFNVEGGGERNPFGLDFKAAGLKWTTDLCMKDSDGDGRTNGQELGDPECKWQKNAIPQTVLSITHPGVCDPWNSTACREKAVTSLTFQNQGQWMDVASKWDEFQCPGLDQPDVKTQTVRFPETPVPAKETTYMCAIFDFETADDVHLIATSPVLDNREVMHHIVVSGCIGEINDREIGVPFECDMSTHQNCTTIISIWSLGQNGECFHSNAGVPIGKRGPKRVALQFHWNNPTEASHFNDSSGMTLYYTAKLRPNDLGILLLGDHDFVIPPNQEQYSVVSTCSPQCTNSIMTDTIHVTAAWNHMHYLGVSQTIDHIRGGVMQRQITNDVTYSYDSPVTHTYSTPIEVRPGDELKTTCRFSTKHKSTSTLFGDSTQQEMCYGFVYYYPLQALKADSCITFSEISFCDNTSSAGCDTRDFFWHQYSPLKKSINETCSVKRCLQECKDAILEAKKTMPCFANERMWRLLRFWLIDNEGGLEFFGKLASCEVELVKDEVQTAKAQLATNETKMAQDEAQRAKDEAQRAKDEAQRAKNETKMAHDEAQRAQDEAQVAKGEAQVAKDEAKLAKDEAILAKDEAILAKDEAILAKDEAILAKDEAKLAKDACPVNTAATLGASVLTLFLSITMTVFF